MNIRTQFFIIIEFILSCPNGIRKEIGSTEILILNNKFCGLLFRVTAEPAAGKSAIPTPVILTICRSMYTYITTACLDISFKGGFLAIIKNITCCVKENYGGILIQ